MADEQQESKEPERTIEVLESNNGRAFLSCLSVVFTVMFLIVLCSRPTIDDEIYDSYHRIETRLRYLESQDFEFCSHDVEGGWWIPNVPFPQKDTCGNPIYPDHESRCVAQTACYNAILKDTDIFITLLPSVRSPIERLKAWIMPIDPIEEAKYYLENVKKEHTVDCIAYANDQEKDYMEQTLHAKIIPRFVLDRFKLWMEYVNLECPKLWTKRMTIGRWKQEG